MTTNKNESTTRGGDAASAQSKMNELYTAHQVHTLAHLMFQQIASGWNGAPSWVTSVGAHAAAPVAGAPNLASWPSAAAVGQHHPPGVTTVPQPFMYWYP
jgi:hypothetical protein